MLHDKLSYSKLDLQGHLNSFEGKKVKEIFKSISVVTVVYHLLLIIYNFNSILFQKQVQPATFEDTRLQFIVKLNALAFNLDLDRLCIFHKSCTSHDSSIFFQIIFVLRIILKRLVPLLCVEIVDLNNLTGGVLAQQSLKQFLPLFAHSLSF